MTERFTERAKRVLELALREALSLGHNYIGTEHLLALARQDDGLAQRLLHDAGLTHDEVKRQTVQLLTPPTPARIPVGTPAGEGYSPLWGKEDGPTLRIWLDAKTDLLVDYSGDIPQVRVVDSKRP